MKYDGTTLLNASQSFLTQMIETLNKAPILSLQTLPADQSAIIIVDMINGFVKEGPMSSPRIQTIIPPISNLMTLGKEQGLLMLAFADCHEKSSIEFTTYPPHCLAGTVESDMIDELKEIGGYELIFKKSTNGFLEPTFHEWLKKNPTIQNFIVVGDCTDICVEQFVLTLKTYFNTLNRSSRIIVATTCVETYETDSHPADLMNVVTFYKMQMNGIEIVREIIK